MKAGRIWSADTFRGSNVSLDVHCDEKNGVFGNIAISLEYGRTYWKDPGNRRCAKRDVKIRQERSTKFVLRIRSSMRRRQPQFAQFKLHLQLCLFCCIYLFILFSIVCHMSLRQDLLMDQTKANNSEDTSTQMCSSLAIWIICVLSDNH